MKLSLIAVPVKAYTAAVSGGGDISLHWLHAACHSRIQYKKVCPVHGEVSKDEIVSGYEYAKDQYVLVEPDEIDKLRTESDKAITIDTFVRPDQLDPIYFSGRTYYLVPDGPVGAKPYAVLHRSMVEQDRYAVAQVVFSGKEQVVLLRPMDRLLTMSFLEYEEKIKKPSTFAEDVPAAEVVDKELELAKMLIDASTVESFDFSKYKDMYTAKLTQLLQAKVEGKEIVKPAEQEAPQVINLMDALRASVAKAQEASAGKAKPPKKMAASRTQRGEAQPTRKRKTS